MLKKFGSLALLPILTFVFAFLLTTSKVSAQTAPSPSPSPSPSCQDTYDGEPGPMSDWVYEIGGGSRTRTWQVGTFDTSTEEFCGFREVSETQYSWCLSNVDSNDGFGTFWFPQGQEPEGAVPGQCDSHKETVTICFQGITMEVEIELLGRYDGYQEGVCSTPDPTPPSCGADEHLNASRTQCVKYDMPGGGDQGGGTTSTGQVLGASTLAATGDGNSMLALLSMILGLILTATGAVYAFKHS